MQLFSENELLIMTIIVGTLLIFLIILTIFDIKEIIKNRKKNLYHNDEPLIENIDISDKSENVLDLDANNNIEIIDDEPIKKQVIVSSVINEVVNDLNNDNYYEPSKMDYKEELGKVKEELENINNNPVSENNIDDLLYKFEMEQEENAIISYEELSKISNNLYDSNETSQYDDGNEPITIDEVLKKFNNKEEIKEEVVDIKVTDKNDIPIYQEKEHIPFISSIYGYEKGSLSFENTATYDKLSIENEDFLAKLKEAHDKND